MNIDLSELLDQFFLMQILDEYIYVNFGWNDFNANSGRIYIYAIFEWKTST